MTLNPRFPNDSTYIPQIEAKIDPNRRFPFVQLKSLVEENLNHLATLNPKHKKIQENNQLVNQKLNFKCHLCSKEFASQVKLTYHLKTDHPEVEKPFACSLCQHSYYKTCNELNLHLGTKHPDEFQLVTKGQKILASVKKLECPHCPKKFTYATLLNRHALSHTNDKPHVCTVCGSKYQQACGLRIHKAEKKCKQVIELKLSKQFQCDHCEVAVRSKEYLALHVHIVHGIKTKKLDLTCLFCGYKAPSSNTLERHNRIHTGEKPFECKACNRAFAVKNNLDAHIRLYCKAAKAIGLEPDVKQQKVSTIITEADIPDAQGRFKCSICEQTFKNKSIRNCHEKVHGDKFRCQFCPTGFKSYVGLNLHKMKLHPKQIVTFKCANCEIVCFSRDGLKKHKWECPAQQKSTVECKKDDQEDKDEGQGSNPSLVHPTLSCVTNNTLDHLGLKNYGSSDVIPTTVLKMEH